MQKNSTKVLITAEGLEKIKKEYRELIEKKLPGAVERVSKARELGDLTENSEYAAAREELDLIERRIADLKKNLDGVQVVDQKIKSSIIVIGSTVIVEVNGEKNEFTIVGSLEADPMRGKISNESPVGKALLGAKVGDIVKVNSAIKAIYKIKEIK